MVLSPTYYLSPMSQSHLLVVPNSHLLKIPNSYLLINGPQVPPTN
jgi:hypothetical protein